MRDEFNVYWLIIIIIIAAIPGAAIGLLVGRLAGAEMACESVKMEWVKDRCMKVTREEVK
jgi:membrane protein DedA with SNARE-associated domain